MTKKRIVHIIVSLDSGGCENMLLRTLPLIDEFEHVIITLHHPGELAPEFGKKGIAVINLGQQGFFDLKSWRTLVQRVNELSPALVMTYLFRADLVGRLYLQQRIHAPVVPFLRTTYNFPRYWPARLFERTTKGLTRHYLANSQAVKDYYVGKIGVAADKINIIPNGIDVRVFDTADRQKIVEELGLPKECFVVTCVANLAPNKGHRYLLEAFESLSHNHSELRLLLVGVGEEEDVLRQQIASYSSRGQIIFLGRRHDIPDILAATNAFVLPTLFEGMSNAILEAMTASLPVVTTDIPENRVLITDHKNGLLVKSAQSQPIYEALEALITDDKLRDRLGHGARRIIEDRFAMPHVLAMWRRALREFSKP